MLMITYHIEDIWPRRDRENSEEEPDWVKDERDHFSKHRDTDGDNKLSKVTENF